MQGTRSSTSLRVACGLLVASIATAPFVVRLASEQWNAALGVFALAVGVPFLACVVWSLGQERRGEASPTFDTRRLAIASILVACGITAICLLGLLGALVNVVLLPLATALLALAWVQPRTRDEVPTVLLGLVASVLIAWFVGRADEYVAEGLIAGLSIIAVLGGLTLIRRRGFAAHASA